MSAATPWRETLRQLFRLPPNGKPMTIMQLAGFPAEVVDSVVSVLCRMAFDFGLWSDGAFPLLFVCEEAHRYASGRPLDRLRPDPQGDLAHRQGGPQVRRVPRPRDAAPGRARLRPSSRSARRCLRCAWRTSATRRSCARRCRTPAANLLAFVPSLGTREVLAFGEGVALPTRLKFKQLARAPDPAQPGGHQRHRPIRRATMRPRTSSTRSSTAGAAPP